MPPYGYHVPLDKQGNLMVIEAHAFVFAYLSPDRRAVEQFLAHIIEYPIRPVLLRVGRYRDPARLDLFHQQRLGAKALHDGHGVQYRLIGV